MMRRMGNELRAPNLPCLFVISQAGKTRMSQVTVRRPLRKFDLRHEQRL